MKGIINSIVPGLVATSVLGITLLPAKPAAADLLKDTALGAAAGVVSGELLNNGSIRGNAINGAAAGAAVGATHNRSNGTFSSIVQDAAVGAAASTLTGEILDNGTPGKNAIAGAAAGAVVNVSKN